MKQTAADNPPCSPLSREPPLFHHLRLSLEPRVVSCPPVNLGVLLYHRQVPVRARFRSAVVVEPLVETRYRRGWRGAGLGTGHGDLRIHLVDLLLVPPDLGGQFLELPRLLYRFHLGGRLVVFEVAGFLGYRYGCCQVLTVVGGWGGGWGGIGCIR